MIIKIADYRELYLVAWSVDRDHLAVEDEIAFGLYQAGWPLVEVGRIVEAEWALLLRLASQFGPIRVKHLGKVIEVVTLDDLKALRANLEV